MKNLQLNPNSKISFLNTDVNQIIKNKMHFDYALLTYVIHEVNLEERKKLIEEIFNIADTIIIGDYLVPQQKGIWKYLNEIVEFLARKDHYKNYLSFKEHGGIMGLINNENYVVVNKTENEPVTSQIVIIKKIGKK